MGLLSWLRGDDALRYGLAEPIRQLATPFSESSHLTPAVVINDIFGAAQRVTRGEAMSIPAVARGRHLVADVLARQPLKAYNAEGVLADQPTWLYRSSYFPTRLRTLLTIDDLIFYGMSLWVLDRGAPDNSGRRQILDACRVPPLQWRIEHGQVVLDIDGRSRTLEASEYLLIPAGEGLLEVGARTIRGARKLEERWTERIDNPIPVVEIRYTGTDDLTPEEMKSIRDDFITARSDTNGTVMVTPSGFEVHPHTDDVLELFIEGRNAVSVDVARFLNIPASMLDASQVNAQGVTYENTGVARGGYYDLSLRSWALPIEEVLSQDDVLPRGQYVQFDLSGLTTPDTGVGPTLED